MPLLSLGEEVLGLRKQNGNVKYWFEVGQSFSNDRVKRLKSKECVFVFDCVTLFDFR